jgi:hypothetical protein
MYKCISVSKYQNSGLYVVSYFLYLYVQTVEYRYFIQMIFEELHNH